MRNWHHKVIKLDNVRLDNNLANRLGDSNVYIGLIEGKIEYSTTGSSPWTISNYEPSHYGFSDIASSRKVFFRGIDSNKKFTQDLDGLDPSPHATSATGIIAANTDTGLIDGVCPNVRVINAENFKDALFISLVQDWSTANLQSDFYKSIKDTKYFVSGAANSADTYSQKKVGIISCSFTDTKLLPGISDFILREMMAYGRDGRGTLLIEAAGNDNAEINGTSGNTAYKPTFSSNKSLIVGASKVVLDVDDLAAYAGADPVFDEKRADYSNYGTRMDLCAPSGPDKNPSRDDINIYSTSLRLGGDIAGSGTETIIVTLLEVNTGSVVIADTKGIFKGQSIEFGDRNSFYHEVRYIEDVRKVSGTNNIKLDLDTGLKFAKTRTSPPFSLVGSVATIVVMRKKITRFTQGGIISQNQFKLEDFKGINPTPGKPQKVYIYPVSSPTSGIETKITAIVNNTKIVQIEGALNMTNYLTTNDQFMLIPDQFSVTTINGNGYVAPSEDEIIGFFDGQQVLVDGSIIATIGRKIYKSLDLPFVPGTQGSSYSIKSLAYGDYTSRFTGTSAATPVVSGLAGLLLSVNPDLNAIEIKHILKITADKIGVSASSYNDAPSASTAYNNNYQINSRYGTGRINALAAVTMARNWHTGSEPKPSLRIADKVVGSVFDGVPVSDPVISPDIWILPDGDTSGTVPTGTALVNTLDTSKPQEIYIRVRNQGTGPSYLESDLRVFIAFTDDATPAFPFPAMWHDNADVKLIGVEKIPIIANGNEAIIKVKWTNISKFWNDYNPFPNPAVAGGRRKRAYILAHVAPFDGDTNLATDNIRGNKNLSCKEIIATHNGVNDGTTSLPGNNFNLTVGSAIVSKNFELTIENALATAVDTIKLRATKKSNNTSIPDEIVLLSKTSGTWGIESGNPDWIAFGTPIESQTPDIAYKDVKFPHTLSVNNEEDEVKIEVVTV